MARIRHPEGKHGTGFLTDDNLLITNNHDIPSREVAAIVKAEFHYDSHDMLPKQYDLDAAGDFATSPKELDDWTAEGTHLNGVLDGLKKAGLTTW